MYVYTLKWGGKWQATPVFFLGELHGQRSLVGYSPRSHKESDMTEATKHTYTLKIYYTQKNEGWLQFLS